jgi:excisionase family DNA binding protein
MDAQSYTSGADLLTTAEVAELVGKTIATVNRWAAAGLLPCAAQANGRLYRRRDVDRFLKQRARAASA